MCVHAAKMLKKMLIVILMIITFTKESLTQDGCTHGTVQLVHENALRGRGIVEVCINSRWSRVCSSGWGDNDAAIVCKQLGYGSEGAIHTVWTGRSSVPIFLNNVDCRSSEATLLNCSHSRRDGGGYKCHYYSGVQCSEERLRVQNVNTAPVNSSNHTVMISWELYSDAPHEPTSFRVWCYNQQRVIEFSLWVSNETLTHVSVGGIVSSVSFACCVSFTYYYLGYYYEAEGKCASTDSNMLLPDSYVTPDPNQPVPTPSSTQMIPASIGSEEVVGSDLNMRASIIGGVLGSIIIILLLLLAICGGALLFLLRSRSMSPKMTVDNNSTDFPNNSRYVTSSTTGFNLQAQGTDASAAAAADYSRIGPSYEITDSRRQHQPEAGGRGNVAALVRLSERYEFSEPHLAMAASARPGGDRGGGVGQGEAAALDYEVPLNSSLSQREGHEEYSRLQH